VGSRIGQHRNSKPVGYSTFWKGSDANNCVKQLMEVTHGGYLWLEEPVSIDVELISFITGLPSRGENPCAVSRRQDKGEGVGGGDEKYLWHRERVTQNHYQVHQ
jgi:hypothetical protein